MAMTLSAARANLPRLIDQVQAGEEITITRHGVPVAVLVHPDALRTPRAAKARESGLDFLEMMDRLSSRSLDSVPGLSPGRADELVAELRAERDRS